jgi:hypothetical protein
MWFYIYLGAGALGGGLPSDEGRIGSPMEDGAGE